MTIHDELMVSLVRKESGITKLEQILDRKINRINFEYATSVRTNENVVIDICPDIVLEVDDLHISNTTRMIAIEIKSDKTWNFSESLRQVKKYRRNQTINWEDVIVIMPLYYEQFSPLYLNEGIKVFVWSAQSDWFCSRCNSGFSLHVERNEIPAKCNKDCRANQNEIELMGLSEVVIELPKIEKANYGDYLKI